MKNKRETIICHDIRENSSEVPTHELTFRPAVYAIIIKDDKVLLTRQWDGYIFPGGGIELGEDHTEALVRETKEETGLDIRVTKLVDCRTSFFTMSNGKSVHSVLIYYLCEITGGRITLDYLEEREKGDLDTPEWIDIADLEKIKFYHTAASRDIIRVAAKLVNK